MYPPTFSNAYVTYQTPKLDGDGDQMYDDEGNVLTEEKTKQYWKYQVNMVYSPKGWDKELLNIGTQAIFTRGQGREQIYHLKELDAEGNLGITGRYTNLADVLKTQSEANKKGLTVAYEMVTEPLPLTADGMIDTAAITSQNYSTLTFKQYPSIPFADLIAWDLTVDELDKP